MLRGGEGLFFYFGGNANGVSLDEDDTVTTAKSSADHISPSLGILVLSRNIMSKGVDNVKVLFAMGVSLAKHDSCPFSNWDHNILDKDEKRQVKCSNAQPKSKHWRRWKDAGEANPVITSHQTQTFEPFNLPYNCQRVWCLFCEEGNFFSRFQS